MEWDLGVGIAGDGVHSLEFGFRLTSNPARPATAPIRTFGMHTRLRFAQPIPDVRGSRSSLGRRGAPPDRIRDRARRRGRRHDARARSLDVLPRIAASIAIAKDAIAAPLSASWTLSVSASLYESEAPSSVARFAIRFAEARKPHPGRRYCGPARRRRQGKNRLPVRWRGFGPSDSGSHHFHLACAA